MKKKILITGGTGFLGSNLINLLKKKNYKIYFTGRNLVKARLIEQRTQAKFYPSSLESFKSLFYLFKKIEPDLVIHAAASKHVDLCEQFPLECIDTNVVGTKNIFQVAKIFNCKDFIFISTDKASPPQLNIYSKSKAIAETMLLLENKDKKINLVILRFGNLLWSTGSVLTEWEKMAFKNKLIKTSGIGMSRFFYNVGDLCKLISILTIKMRQFSNSIIIPNTKSASIQRILKIFCKKYKVKSKKMKKRTMDNNCEKLLNSEENKIKKIINLGNQKAFVLKYPFTDLRSSSSNEELNSFNSIQFSDREIEKFISNKSFFDV